MKQINNNTICIYCLGCMKLENENFDGVMNCKNFIQGKDTTEFYKKLKEGKKNGMQTSGANSGSR